MKPAYLYKKARDYFDDKKRNKSLDNSVVVLDHAVERFMERIDIIIKKKARIINALKYIYFNGIEIKLDQDESLRALLNNHGNESHYYFYDDAVIVVEGGGDRTDGNSIKTIKTCYLFENSKFANKEQSEPPRQPSIEPNDIIYCMNKLFKSKTKEELIKRESTLLNTIRAYVADVKKKRFANEV